MGRAACSIEQKTVTTMSDTILELESITKSFDGKVILDDLNLKIYKNEFITLLGPSGCGKSTLLRIIGGFVHPDRGRVLYNGQDITNLPPDKRNLHTVFQKYSLFPHYNVRDNIAFGLKLKKKSKAYIDDKVDYALHLVNMEGFEERRPDSLSGGQQQRVAIARAIVNEPDVLLLDEPLGALDLKLRRGMQRELMKIKREVGITFIYVTHDQGEALTMSDRIIVMNQGYVQQMGDPRSIYDEPQNAFVADFIGESNIIDGIMVRDCLVRIQGHEVTCVDTGFEENEPVDVTIRPEDLTIVGVSDGFVRGTVTDVIYEGAYYDIRMRDELDYEWQIQSVTAAVPGSQVGLSILPENIQIMHKPRTSAEEAVRE